MRNLLHLLRPRVRHTALYQYHSGAPLMPGAGLQVFEPSFPLPLFRVQGHGVQAGNAPRPLQGPQVFARNTKGISGIGGLVAGQMLAPGPLLDVDNNG